ncbi:hypothetical protein EV424DRAFT_1348472 [Suillus variegatus]|nr:hypothetical protein EV424DRAFT_1348472 [Suillus variegatus]
MRFAAESLWIAFLSSLLLLMVSCGASRCSWERATDARGLSRHHASCHFYKKSSVLASQRRLERAKEAVFTHSTTTSIHRQAGSSTGNRDSDLSKSVNNLHTSETRPSETNRPLLVTGKAKARVCVSRFI